LFKRNEKHAFTWLREFENKVSKYSIFDLEFRPCDGIQAISGLEKLGWGASR
jgi:hypothetical protein